MLRSRHRTIGAWQSTLSEATTKERCLIVPPLATAESALTSSPISARCSWNAPKFLPEQDD